MRTEENKNKDIVIAGVELYPPMKCAHRLNAFVILKRNPSSGRCGIKIQRHTFFLCAFHLQKQNK